MPRARARAPKLPKMKNDSQWRGLKIAGDHDQEDRDTVIQVLQGINNDLSVDGLNLRKREAREDANNAIHEEIDKMPAGIPRLHRPSAVKNLYEIFRDQRATWSVAKRGDLLLTDGSEDGSEVATKTVAPTRNVDHCVPPAFIRLRGNRYPRERRILKEGNQQQQREEEEQGVEEQEEEKEEVEEEEQEVEEQEQEEEQDEEDEEHEGEQEEEEEEVEEDEEQEEQEQDQDQDIESNENNSGSDIEEETNSSEKRARDEDDEDDEQQSPQKRTKR
ncbi:hypothetical protein N7454_001062 [Penicillium verhagenii]|nr:hypothetical protein N7454_001062 [Penicillium verhagenii]